MNSADSDPAADNALGSDVTPVELDTKSTLEKRFMQAVTDTGQSDAIVPATPKPADSGRPHWAHYPVSASRLPR